MGMHVCASHLREKASKNSTTPLENAPCALHPQTFTLEEFFPVKRSHSYRYLLTMFAVIAPVSLLTFTVTISSAAKATSILSARRAAILAHGLTWKSHCLDTFASLLLYFSCVVNEHAGSWLTVSSSNDPYLDGSEKGNAMQASNA